MLKFPLALLGALFIFPPAEAALPFATAPAQHREVDLTYAAEAVVEAVNQATMAAQISGRVIEVAFDAGDAVKKGQVLVRIDESEARQAVAGSEAEVAQAQANLQNSRLAYDRSKQLLAQKFISQAAVDKAQADYRSAEAQLKVALARVGQTTATRGFATIVAPYDGIIASRQVELGEMASPGKALMTFFSPKGLRVVASIPQYKLAQVRQSSRAQVEFPELKQWVPGTRVTLLPVADTRTHTTRARVDLPADLKGIYPGMFARAHFSIGRAQKLLIPASAVVRRSEVAAVYVVDAKEQISFRQIRLGEPVGQSEVEVLSGLVQGEQVALEPIKAGITLKGKQQ
ncbi:MAG: efflux RND transporter periplasmic adaptor subunit [Sulfurimicrobium sp.]|nr:efflux RND transporter periplasmic adaptor subunit [Sulfurimicrobium sp.]MDO9188726.1 efflux RND transporter periplasmic adaptor subunit [Sulfurimicrobium sp.]MDP1704510.1 efflux RND transporter periplasmic adaptor subunit [Sulfurimicrobium sp.]MDP2198365.1 efflux RND transporter periplasmic adaptor subunit [Sulfurimicrobium sp.]MDP2961785.1 efflux RND transporter periplasmic adaptor subunit [Sulfurimicrobium sp.]